MILKFYLSKLSSKSQSSHIDESLTVIYAKISCYFHISISRYENNAQLKTTEPQQCNSGSDRTCFSI